MTSCDLPTDSGGILCLGEALLDCIGGREIPGGAPANVACHAAALCARGGLLSRVGEDERGRRLAAWLRTGGVSTLLLQTDPAVPTGMVLVEITGGLPRYDIEGPVAWDFVEATPVALSAVRTARVMVCGTLAQRMPVSRGSIRQLLAEGRAAGALVLADLNLRAPYFDEEIVLWTLRYCDVLKLNDEELLTVAGLIGARGETVELFAGLLREFGISRAVLTCGAGGAWCHEGGRTWHVPAVPTEVSDTVGAGDAFTAVLATALAAGKSLRDAAPWCSEVAAFVASQAGATPHLPEAMVSRLRAALPVT
ncbi:MAG: carbohydrate kinase [Chthoniobacterales bacterium]|nr:carbohydrate kinase [Chthoniobacterales bacterium]